MWCWVHYPLHLRRKTGNIPEVKPEPYYLKDDMLIYDEDSLEPVKEKDKEILKKLDLHKQ